MSEIHNVTDGKFEIQYEVVGSDTYHLKLREMGKPWKDAIEAISDGIAVYQLKKCHPSKQDLLTVQILKIVQQHLKSNID